MVSTDKGREVIKTCPTNLGKYIPSEHFKQTTVFEVALPRVASCIITSLAPAMVPKVQECDHVTPQSKKRNLNSNVYKTIDQ